MKRLAIPLSILAVATVTACAAPYYAPAQNERVAPIAPQAVNYRPGFGWVQSIRVSPSMGAATGASQASSDGRLNRLAVRMDSGEIQYIDTDSNEIRKGDRVELTPDRMIRKVQ